MGTIWYFIYGPGRRVDVPNVVGLQDSTAEKLLVDTNLDPNKKAEFSDTVPSGIVISTKPSAKQKVKPGTKIALVVSKGVQMVPLPDVVGKSKDEAIEALKAAPLTIGKISEEYSGQGQGNIYLPCASGHTSPPYEGLPGHFKGARAHKDS